MTFDWNESYAIEFVSKITQNTFWWLMTSQSMRRQIKNVIVRTFASSKNPYFKFEWNKWGNCLNVISSMTTPFIQYSVSIDGSYRLITLRWNIQLVFHAFMTTFACYTFRSLYLKNIQFQCIEHTLINSYQIKNSNFLYKQKRHFDDWCMSVQKTHHFDFDGNIRCQLISFFHE